jgi:serine/threonine-protein kinase PknK
LPIAVNHAAVTALGGRLYVLGGDLGGGGKSARLYRYSPETDRWRRLPDAPTARSALALVGIGDKLYAAGGASATDDTLRTLEIYDLERRRWTRGPKMPTGRNHVGATYFKRGLVVTGGRPGPVHGGLTTVEYYQPRTRSWERWPPLGVARSGHAAVAIGRAPLGGRVVVFGGEELDGGTTIEEVEILSPRVGGWSRLPDMVTPRHGVGGAAKGLRVYALEGGPQPGLAYSSALEYLDLER